MVSSRKGGPRVHMTVRSWELGPVFAGRGRSEISLPQGVTGTTEDLVSLIMRIYH